MGTEDSDSEMLNLCKLTAKSEPSCVLITDQATEATHVLDQKVSNQLPDLSLDMQPKVDPLCETPGTKPLQLPVCMQGEGEEADKELHSTPSSTTGLLHPHTSELGQDNEGGLGEGDVFVDIKSTPMEVDLPLGSPSLLDTFDKKKPFEDNIESPDLKKNGDFVYEPEQVSSGSVTQLVDSEVSDGTSGDKCTAAPNKTSIREVEDHCVSLATALKELHKLLIMSGQASCKMAEKPPHPAETIPEVKDEEEHCQNGCLNKNPSTQNNEVISEQLVNGENTSSFVKREGGIGNSDKALASPENLHHEVASESTVGLDTSDKVGVCVTHSSDSPVADVHSDCLLFSRPDANAPPNIGITLEEASIDPSIDDPISESSPETGRPLREILASAPGSHPVFSDPVFPPSAVEWIVSAGFTLQDAICALERADGNAELALLSLLAKGIVVPT
ncbi:regulatory solute carrier protein family 1 member 1 [Discoglossus pictus]